jgi:hypothetical protein
MHGCWRVLHPSICVSAMRPRMRDGCMSALVSRRGVWSWMRFASRRGRVAEASFVEVSAWTHIHTRNVASATIAVAQILGCCFPRFALAVALGTISLNTLLCEGVAGRMTLQPRQVA